MIERDEQVEGLMEKTASNEEQVFEVGLRPQSLAEFIGQDALKENIQVFIDAAKQRGEAADHVLLYGNPGLGKTTLAHIFAKEMGSKIRVTSGPALEKVGDLAAILSNLKEGDILFIDEIHRMNRSIEEVLYPAMEDYCLDIVVGKGPTARTLRLNLERFTIIGATTRLSLLSSPMRDRFGAIFHLDFYSEDNIAKILARSAGLLDVAIHEPAVNLLSTRSRCTPRIANRLLRRIRDYAQVRADGVISGDVAQGGLDMLNIDKYGMDKVDRRILMTILETFSGGPVGLSTIAAATGEEVSTIEEVHEPFLMQIGMLERTPRGRCVTQRAKDHMNESL